MEIVDPNIPEFGVKEMIWGGKLVKTKPPRLAVPCGVTTTSSPLDPEAEMIAVIMESDTTVYDAAGVPPKLTAVAPDRCIPLIVTLTPELADAGVKEVMTAPSYINPDKIPEPAGPVTTI